VKIKKINNLLLKTYQKKSKNFYKVLSPIEPI
jgi:hypothetical protein